MKTKFLALLSVVLLPFLLTAACGDADLASGNKSSGSGSKDKASGDDDDDSGTDTAKKDGKPGAKGSTGAAGGTGAAGTTGTTGTTGTAGGTPPGTDVPPSCETNPLIYDADEGTLASGAKITATLPADQFLCIRFRGNPGDAVSSSTVVSDAQGVATILTETQSYNDAANKMGGVANFVVVKIVGPGPAALTITTAAGPTTVAGVFTVYLNVVGADPNVAPPPPAAGPVPPTPTAPAFVPAPNVTLRVHYQDYAGANDNIVHPNRSIPDAQGTYSVGYSPVGSNLQTYHECRLDIANRTASGQLENGVSRMSSADNASAYKQVENLGGAGAACNTTYCAYCYVKPGATEGPYNQYGACVTVDHRVCP